MFLQHTKFLTITNFDVMLTVHLSINLVNDQLDTKFFYFLIRLLQSSTCFEQRRAHHQEIKFYLYSIWSLHYVSGRPVHRTTTYREWRYRMLYGRNHRPKHVELIGIINKPLLLRLVCVYIIYINDARSNKYQMQLWLLSIIRIS
jgi:hypothetical protein